MNINSEWLSDYLAPYAPLISDEDVGRGILLLREEILKTQRSGGKILLAGNGASASIASHLAADFTKQAGVRAMTFNEPNLITALGNDFGYERWVEKALEFYSDPRDLVILISSSGKSPNLLRAAEWSVAQGLSLVTLSGFAPDNPLRAMGQINLWANSRSYNIVECVHMIWLTAALDAVIGKAEYSVG